MLISGDAAIAGILGERFSSPGAFVFYCPKAGKEKELLFYNDEAWRVLSRSLPDSAGETVFSSSISSLCLKWRDLLERGPGITGVGGNLETDFIDTLQSGRRRYIVKGTILSDAAPSPSHGRKYLFILERGSPDKIKLLTGFRNLNLNRREQQIVQLLLSGSSNKEIADSLGISLNTVKGYMKLLSRKLRVNNRAGIIAAVLAAK
jgi:DNA-binding CsgD family transcriptional regulator